PPRSPNRLRSTQNDRRTPPRSSSSSSSSESVFSPNGGASSNSSRERPSISPRAALVSSQLPSRSRIAIPIGACSNAARKRSARLTSASLPSASRCTPNVCPQATEMKLRLDAWDVRNGRLGLELHVARVVGDLEGLVHRDHALVHPLDQRLVEGLHPVVLALL